MVLIVIVTVGCRWWSLCVTVTERVTVRVLQVSSEWVDVTVCGVYCRCLASGSGDTTVRFWDVDTETPHHCCQRQYCLSTAQLYSL